MLGHAVDQLQHRPGLPLGDPADAVEPMLAVQGGKIKFLLHRVSSVAECVGMDIYSISAPRGAVKPQGISIQCAVKKETGYLYKDFFCAILTIKDRL